MKSYIRAILNDLKKQSKPQPTTSNDLENQILSKDPAEKVKQLDQQAQKSEERQTLS